MLAGEYAKSAYTRGVFWGDNLPSVWTPTLQSHTVGTEMKAGPIAGTLCVLTLLGPAPASAAISATAAPIGSASSGSYLVTVANEGPKTEGVILIELAGSETATGIVPGDCVYGQPVAGSVIGCPQIEAGATLQVCYNGPQTEKVEVFYAGAPAIPLSTVGPVASCPLAGFVPKSTGEGEGSAGTGGGGSGGGPGSGSVAKFSFGQGQSVPQREPRRWRSRCRGRERSS